MTVFTAKAHNSHYNVFHSRNFVLIQHHYSLNITSCQFITGIHISVVSLSINVLITNFQSPFSNLFQRNITKRIDYNLRSVFCKKYIAQFSMKSSGPRLWNNLPLLCKKATSLYIFKKCLKISISVRFCISIDN